MMLKRLAPPLGLPLGLPRGLPRGWPLAPPLGWPLRLVRAYSQRSADSLRNLGIIAHIDAGKTTTTERMLYYAGVTQRLGNVDSGDTVTDFLAAERERGITIQAAAITFDWSGHPINIIDTPGHADFNFEVVRSLRVLDGAITILDSVAGVEALTEKVWGLANLRRLPRIVYLNKMDRPGAGFGRSVREVVAKLRTRVALLTIPVWQNEKLVGIVDVLHQRRITYLSEDGKQVEVVDVQDTEQRDEAEAARQSVVDVLSDVNEAVIEEYLEKGAVSTETLVQALQAATLAGEVTPVLCGSSFRNIGIQPLLDAAVQFLPSPKQAEQQTKPTATAPTSSAPAPRTVEMLAFKVRQDPRLGLLVYVRVYSGTLKRNSTVWNTTTQKAERISRLLRMQADEPQEIESVAAGDIAVLSGSLNISTGDTLVAHASKPNGVSSLSPHEKTLKLLPIPVPPPVFVTRISPKGPGDVRGMNAALTILLREDPSLHLSFDEEAGQHLLSGMGELHLEIATNRLVEDLKARVDVGDVMITYKETLSEATPSVVKEGRDAAGGLTTVEVSLGPNNEDTHEDKTRVSTKATKINLVDQNIAAVSFRHPRIDKHSVADLVGVGITPVLAKGGGLGRYALHGLSIDVSVRISPESESPDLVAPLVRAAMTEALTSGHFRLLEPVMQVRISSPQAQVGTISTDLSSTRRGVIESMAESSDAGDSIYPQLAQNMWTPLDHTMHLSKHEDAHARPVVVSAQVPLRKMVGYLSSLRSMTQGRGTFEMSFEAFNEVPAQDVQEVLEN